MTRKPTLADSAGTESRNLTNDAPDRGKGGRFPDVTPSHNGHVLWTQIRNALTEKDVIHLRELLSAVAGHPHTQTTLPEGLFDLAEFIDIGEFLEKELADMEETQTTRPLPKIHVHHHRRASREAVHHCYQKAHGDLSADSLDTEDFVSGDSPVWEELEEAVREQDVSDLRDRLRLAAASVAGKECYVEAIDRFLEKEMTPAEMTGFEHRMKRDPRLAAEVALHAGIPQALSEPGVQELRDALGRVMNSNHSTARNVEEIDSYLGNDLAGRHLDDFLAELSENRGLKAEVKLVKEVNEALSEKMVFRLREKLGLLSKGMKRDERSAFLTEGGFLKSRRRAVAAAVVVFAIGLSFVFRFQGGGGNDPYSRYYAPPPAMTAFRTEASAGDWKFREGLNYFSRAEYDKALECFLQITGTGVVNPPAEFYAGASYQGLSGYRQAVVHFDRVLDHRDNLFVEQSQWYKSLCHIAMGGKGEAVALLEAIAAEKGYYSRKADVLLRKLRRKG